jgi:hypothetical protein
MVVVSTSFPDFPVTVTVLVPVAALPPAESVRLLDVVVGFGENEAETPFGSPDAENVTLPLNPPTALIDTVLVAPEPCFIEMLDGEAVTVNPGVGFTVN